MKRVLVSAALVWVGAAMLLAQAAQPPGIMRRHSHGERRHAGASGAAREARVASGRSRSRSRRQWPHPLMPRSIRRCSSRYRFACHSSKSPQPGNDPVNLEVASLDNLLPHAATWERVLRKLSVRAMPPQGAPHPAEADYTAFTAWLSASLDRAWQGKSTPGRYVVHRLNRTEYGNAIRDLLALDIDTAELLPSDGADFGFDNIAASLRTSPLLLERYLTAAQRISTLAVGDPSAVPARANIRSAASSRRADTSMASRSARAAARKCGTSSLPTPNTSCSDVSCAASKKATRASKAMRRRTRSSSPSTAKRSIQHRSAASRITRSRPRT